MTPKVVDALRSARLGATAYLVAWVLFSVSWLALAIGAFVYPSMLGDSDTKSAFVITVMLAMVTCPLLSAADAWQCITLTLFARACGRATSHPLFVAFLSLTMPLVGTAMAVGSAREAMAGIERAPTLPSTKLTVWWPIAGWFIGSFIGGFFITLFARAPADPDRPPPPDPLPIIAVVCTILIVGGLRILLAKRIRDALNELLARPSVDERRASRTEPVAGG